MTHLIYEQINLCMKEITAISKDKRNTQGSGFNYRGIDDIYNVLHSILVQHKVFTVPTVVDMKREERTSKSGGTLAYSILTIEYKFYTLDGSFITATMVGEAMDSGDKASNKAQSVAHKYALLQVFAIPTVEEKDPDSESHETKPKYQEPPSSEQRHASMPPPFLDDSPYGPPPEEFAPDFFDPPPVTKRASFGNAEFPSCPICGTKMLKSKFETGPQFYCPNKKNHK